MAIIIGGSSSSGSSLLQTILNRHTKIYCGHETSLFAKRELYVHWERYKKRILRLGFQALRNPSWFMLNGIDLKDPGKSWEENNLHQILDRSETFEAFANAYFTKILELEKKSIWIEKTPTNAINFTLFLESFENAKVIHMIRNPYDVITSLIKRGYSPYFACGLYLCNTASGLNASDSKSYYEVKYEDLVSSPRDTIKNLSLFLDLEFEEQMLDTSLSSLNMENSIAGWNYNAGESIGKKSIGSFKTLRKDVKKDVLGLMNSMELRGNHRCKYNTFKGLCEQLEYDFTESQEKVSFKHKIDRIRDMIERTRRTYPTHLFNYPVKFN